MTVSTNTKWSKWFVLLLVFALPGDEIFADSHESDTGLLKYAGSYNGHILLDEPEVQTALVKMLGDNLAHFFTNLDVRGSIDLIAGSLSLSGNAMHRGGEEEAVLCVATYDSAVSAALFTGGNITVFSRHADYGLQSQCIKDWITQVNSAHRDRLSQPGNVQIKSSQ
jgi:hypothetical protein